MPKTIEIPLFPLQVVLYPTIATNLQVFEQRYLRLVRESLAKETQFGVVPITKGREAGSTPEIYPWGTVVAIQDWSQLPNGLFGIVISGDQRLQVLDTTIEEDGLMVAQAEIYESDPAPPIGFEDDDLVDMLEGLAKHMGVDSKIFLDGLNKATLAWRLGGVLPVQPELKMALLAIDDVDERLLEIKKWVVEMKMRRSLDKLI
jgi:hypothetical protein